MSAPGSPSRPGPPRRPWYDPAGAAVTRRVVPWVALVVVVVGTLVAGAGSGGDDPTPAARARRLSAQLRCPVCEGLSVADSPSDTARNIAADVRRRVEAGETDDEIRQAYVDRFGEDVLLTPPRSGVGAVVWLLPLVALGAAGGGLLLAFRRWRAEPAAEPTDADRDLVEHARTRRNPGGA